MADFIDGQQDCRDGYPAEIGRNLNYYTGYKYEYELEQVATHRSQHGY